MPKPTQMPAQGANGPSPNAGQYYDWTSNGPDMSKYSAPTSGAPPPYGFANSYPANPPPYSTQPPPAYPPSAPQGTTAAPYPPPQDTVVTVPVVATNARSQQMIKRILCIRISIVVVGLVITIVGGVSGYYSVHRYHYY